MVNLKFRISKPDIEYILYTEKSVCQVVLNRKFNITVTFSIVDAIAIIVTITAYGIYFL